MIKNIWRTFLVCLILILTSGAGASPLAERGPEAQLYPLTLITHSGAHAFEVEIADTPEATTRGLMFRRELAPDFGMLFDFHAPQPQSFWMKNTYVSLDMVFIGVDDGEATVRHVAENTEPFSLDPIQYAEPVRYVLEVVAGTADKIGLAPGDTVDLSALPPQNRD